MSTRPAQLRRMSGAERHTRSDSGALYAILVRHKHEGSLDDAWLAGELHLVRKTCHAV